MTQQTAELVEAWIGKATNDIVSARQILLLSDGPTDTACFHAQQAMEKALKALLTTYHVPFPKTHSLLRLLELVLPFSPILEEYREHLAELSVYGVEFRYPGPLPDPDREETLRLFKIAEEFLETVRYGISEDA